MERLLKQKVLHQSRLDVIESDLEMRIRAMKGDHKLNETKEDRINILETHVKHLYEARGFISEVCEENLNLRNNQKEDL